MKWRWFPFSKEKTPKEQTVTVPLTLPTKKRFKVLYVIKPVRDEIVDHFLQFINSLDQEQYEIFVAGPTSILNKLQESNVVLFPLQIEAGFRLVKDLKDILKLKRIMREEEIEIVHAHSYKAAWLGGLAARWSKVPLVIFTFHNFVVDERTGRLKHLFSDLTERFLPSLADRIITASKALRRRVLEKGKIEGSRVVMIYDGITSSSFAPVSSRRIANIRHMLALKTKVPLVVTVTRLIPQKGVKYLIAAATHILRAVPNAQILIVGDGPLRRELEVMAEKLGIHRRVIFTGFRKDIKDILAAANVFVLPVLTEGLPVVALEAMAFGKPVVATAVGGIPEVVIDRRTGFLVPPRKPMALAEAIIYLLLNKEVAIQMGMAGRRRVEENFDLKETVDKTEQIYRELLTEWKERMKEERSGE